MANFYFFILIFLIPVNVLALESITLNIKQLERQHWKFQGIKIHLGAISQSKQVLTLFINKMTLPQPFEDIKLLNIRCSKFTWKAHKIQCEQGETTLHSNRFNALKFSFSFLISPEKMEFSLGQLTLLKGAFNLHASMRSNQWQVSLKGQQVDLLVLQKLFLPPLKLTQGQLDFSILAKGTEKTPHNIQTTVNLQALSIQSNDGSKATEELTLKTTLNAHRVKHHWYWQQQSSFSHGNIYIDPLYVENKNAEISLSSQGEYHLPTHQLIVDKLHLNHPDIFSVEAFATLELKPTLKVTHANAYANVISLEKLAKIYLNPIFETIELEGLSLKGRIEAGVNVHQHEVDNAYLISTKLTVEDPQKRFKLQEGALTLNWSNDQHAQKPSTISWEQLDLFSIPLPRTYFNLLIKKKQISLLKAFNIPLLGGNIQIKKFEYEMMEDNSPYVDFAGEIHALSLAKLTDTLGINALSGNISGDIPGVHFSENKLNLEGGLKINLFGGEIDINQLSLSGIGTNFSQFESNVQFTGIDLDQLTQKFEFGGMKGKLSGFINDLKMENWQPIQFFAWIGSEDSDEDHQISQKAVENLASLGGGVAIDFITRMILGLFDNFSYEKIGLGCYLHHGICQLSGVEPAGERGFYIVKGGGLPRIDIMGHHTEMLWDVFLERLERLSTTSNLKVSEPTATPPLN
jgi:hypothetical protein